MTANRLSDLVGKLWSGDLSRREFMKRATAAGIGASAISAALSQGTMAAPGTRSRLGKSAGQIDATTLVIADNLNGGAWLTLDPNQFYEINPSAAMNMIYEALYTIPDGSKPTELVPLLATDFPVFSEDGLTATISLRPGVKFHTSGNEMTSADVVFSFNRLKYAGAQSAFLGSDYWTEVTAVDPLTVQLTLASPNAALAAVLTSIPLSIMDSARVKEFGGTDAVPAEVGVGPEFDANLAARDIINGDSVGTGPFMVTQWDVDSEIIIERNPDYWGEAEILERVIWRNTNEAGAQLQLVQIGEVDMAYSLPVDQVEAVKADANLQIISGPTLELSYMAMNMTEEFGGPLANKDVRQAIAYAIDYDGFVNEIMGGAALRPATAVPLPLTGSEAVLPKAYVLDLAKAQALWDGAAVGEQEIELIYDSDSPAPGGASYETLAVKLKSDLEQITGLTLKLSPMPGTERIAQYRAGEFQLTLSPWTPDYPDVDTYVGPFARTDTAAAKRVGFSDPEVDAWLDAGLAELDPTAREAIYVQIQERMIDAAAFVVLYQPNGQKAARTTVQNVAIHSVYMYQLRGASKTE